MMIEGRMLQLLLPCFVERACHDKRWFDGAAPMALRPDQDVEAT
jgi:hypothetical protein